jgi:hypothetical protein
MLGVALGSVGQNGSQCGSRIFRLTNEFDIVSLHAQAATARSYPLTRFADQPRKPSRDTEAALGGLMHLNVLIVIDQK